MIRQRLKLIFGALVLVLMCAFFAASFYAEWQFKTRTSHRGWEAMEIADKPVIYIVYSDGPTALLQAGDEIVALKGEPREAFPLLYRDECAVAAGTRYALVIRRGGQMQEVALETLPFSLGSWIRGGVTFFTCLIFLLTALTVFVLKPYDQQAWLLALALGLFNGIFLGRDFGLSGWPLGVLVVGRVIGLAFLPVFFHFFLIFPERGPWLRRFPRLEYWLYLPFVLTILPFRGLQRIEYYLDVKWLADLLPFRNLLKLFTQIFVVGYLVGGLAALAGNYRAANAQARRKLRFVVVGCGAGFFNILLVLLAEFLEAPRTHPQWYDGLRLPMLVTLPLIPLSFAYAIFRHQIIPVSLIIRRGVRYVLVSRGSILLMMLVVSVVMFIVMDTFFYYLNPSNGRIVGVISAIVAIATWLLSRAFHQRVLAPLIDRRFFRQAYDTQQIIADLTAALRTTTSLPQLLELVATKIQSALQTESVAVLLRDEATGDYSSRYACVYNAKDGQAIAAAHDFKLPRHAVALTRLVETGQPLEISPNGNSGALEQETLRQMKSALLLPLAATTDLPGIVSLGPRLGDLPFSRADKRLLMSVAGPATLALENARLVEQMIAEARRRQELEAENEQRAKELEEARQLQLSMLPKQVPQLLRLEIAAYMKTATEVGGDYYDFHLAADGTLTIAIGDATGHGLKAGTVVTAIKGLFSHLAPQAELTEILRDASCALKQMNLRSLFMALTLVRLRGQHLQLSAAGMPPALLYRAARREIETLRLTGAPLGSLTSYQYKQQETVLEAGDVLVLLSDGLPERFNTQDELFGDEQVGAALLAVAERSPQEIIEALSKAGEAWAQGRAQDDDVTLVVLKVRSPA
jgi:serine phosphatase RsbU (regulator of sigma subunit)